MDKFYDCDEAAHRLNELSAWRVQNEHSGIQLSTLVDNEDWSTKYEVKRTGVSWRLCHRNTKGGQCEEAVFELQGVIANKLFSPITHNVSNIKHLRQGVTLIGFDCEYFSKSLASVSAVHVFLDRAVGEGDLLSCNIISTSGIYSTLEMSNRYFTPINDNPNNQAIALSSEIDPYGYMAKAAAGKYIHCDDNVVRCYIKEKTKENDYRFVETNSTHFRIGDIVEVQVSFILVPFGAIRDSKFKSTMVLRSIALLDETVTQNATINRQREPKIKPAIQIIKRRFGYDEEEMSYMNANLQRMETEQMHNKDTSNNKRTKTNSEAMINQMN